jgi:F420-dependent oxidoreductase-like protein
MRFALMIEGQMGLSYEDLLALARRAEAAGFEAFFRSDHYQSFPGPEGEPTTDAWATLAGIARETSRIRLGALVSPVTFRHPGNFAKIVSTVDEMSGGRVEAGFGAGWNDAEHRQHGLAFPEIATRAEMLEETIEIVRGLFDEPDGWSFHGRHNTVDGAVFHPKGFGRQRPPFIVGSSGSARSYRIAARWADEFNFSSNGPDQVREKNTLIDAACVAAGRDPLTLRRSAMVGTVIGRDGPEVDRRIQALLDGGVDEGEEGWLAARRKRWILGTPDVCREMVRRFEDAGVERLMLQDFLPHDLGMVDLMGEELVRAMAPA